MHLVVAGHDDRRRLEGAQFGLSGAYDRLVGGEEGPPARHYRAELVRVHRQEALAVRWVLLDAFGEERHLHDRLHTATLRRLDELAVVVVAQPLCRHLATAYRGEK